jgi:hypothetical protein
VLAYLGIFVYNKGVVNMGRFMISFRKIIAGVLAGGWLGVGACLAPHTSEHGELNRVDVSVPRSSCWVKIREEYIRKHFICEACGSTEDLQVHHVIPFNLDSSKECDPENLITLCARKTHNCHLWIGHGGNYKTYNPNCREDAQYFHTMITSRKPNRQDDAPDQELE